MKWLPVWCYLGIALWQVSGHYREIWPSDPAAREALHLCFMANLRFDPLDRAAHDACLKGHLAKSQMQLMGTQLTPQHTGG